MHAQLPQHDHHRPDPQPLQGVVDVAAPDLAPGHGEHGGQHREKDVKAGYGQQPVQGKVLHPRQPVPVPGERRPLPQKQGDDHRQQRLPRQRPPQG